MREKIAGISFELTGSELIALLKESREIKELRPLYNRRQKRIVFSWGIYDFYDEHGYLNFRIRKIGRENKEPLISFINKMEALNFMNNLVKKHWLCQKLCGLYETEGSCFHYNIRQCNGACIQKEAKSVYNARAVQGFQTNESENLLVIDCGRTLTERALVSLENGIYRGYGYLDITESYLGVNDMLECIKPAMDNSDTRSIIKSWLVRNKVEKLIRY